MVLILPYFLKIFYQSRRSEALKDVMDNLPDSLGTLYKDCAHPLALVDSSLE